MYEQYIGIFGGGIAGFALADHCEKFNIPYRVVISNDDASNGYGITIQEADNIIQYLNLKPNLEKINYLNRYVKINKNEEIIFANCHSKGNYVISRAYLIALFREKINQENIIRIKDNEIIPCIFKVKGRYPALILNITLAYYLNLRWPLSLNKYGKY